MCHGHHKHSKWGRHGCGGHMGKHGYRGYWGRGNAYHPPINILESDAGYELHLAAPGRSKEDFRLSVKDDVLTITGRRPEGRPESEWRRREYQLAAFERRFELNPKIDPEGISARYVEGILVVTLPKRPGADLPDQEIFVA